MDQQLNKWQSWLETIESEVTDLTMAKYMFGGVRSLIESNPLLHQPSSFYDYLAQTYVSHVVIGIRRQTKVQSESISMARLFKEMIEAPQVLTRAHFVDMYKGIPMKRGADGDFDMFSVPGDPHIDPLRVRTDLARLKDALKRCEDFADKRIAHRDMREPTQPPTLREIDACVELLDQLCVRYILLFRATFMDTLLPTSQYDWAAIFKVPCILSEAVRQ